MGFRKHQPSSHLPLTMSTTAPCYVPSSSSPSTSSSVDFLRFALACLTAASETSMPMTVTPDAFNINAAKI